MILNILLELLSPSTKPLQLEAFVLSHPNSTAYDLDEIEILEKIIDIVNIRRDIGRFTQSYCSDLEVRSIEQNSDDEDEVLENSAYLEAFSNGVNSALEQYKAEITEIKKSFSEDPSHTKLYLYHKINVYQPILAHIQELIHHIKANKNLHNCAIMNYVHENKLHANLEICKGMKIVQAAVNILFFNQLTQWLLYANIDNNGEFFIQYSSNEHNKSSNTNYIFITGNNSSQDTNDFDKIWQYDIVSEYLPQFVSPTIAEKILFIGQTVLMFQVRANRKKLQQWTQLQDGSMDECSLWNNEENVFIEKVKFFEDINKLSSINFELLIDGIKSHVTKRLSEIAVNQTDLINQFKLVRNYYLLGKGELYAEFIKEICESKSMQDELSTKENLIEDVIVAFQLAGARVGVTDELNQITMKTSKDATGLKSSSTDDFMNTFILQHTIKWPLQLLFTPKVIQSYNKLFCFLFHIKRLQYNLHYTWHMMRRDTKLNETILQLRQQFIFVIDTIQSYIQADVLENQFNVLMSTVRDANDFEQIQRAHNDFLANTLYLCFLLGSYAPYDVDNSSETAPNPVLKIFKETFYLCEQFCKWVKLINSGLFENMDRKFQNIKSEFLTFVAELMNALLHLKLSPSHSQLLLRLDYNHWFSKHTFGFLKPDYD